jgi:hypothetical protein
MNLPKYAALAKLFIFGAIVGGLYGALHDQITYSISPEYFTKMKFAQFHYADFGLSKRFFVAEIGFLATWWVGAFCSLVLALIAVTLWPAKQAFRRVIPSIGIILATATATGIVFAIRGKLIPASELEDWVTYRYAYGLEDLPAFVQVAYIHNGSYLGGLIGLIAAIGFLIFTKLRSKTKPAVEPLGIA